MLVSKNVCTTMKKMTFSMSTRPISLGKTYWIFGGRFSGRFSSVYVKQEKVRYKIFASKKRQVQKTKQTHGDRVGACVGERVGGDVGDFVGSSVSQLPPLQ